MKLIAAFSAVVTALLLTGSAAASDPAESQSATLQTLSSTPSSTLTPSASSFAPSGPICEVTRRRKLKGFFRFRDDDEVTFEINRIKPGTGPLPVVETANMHEPLEDRQWNQYMCVQRNASQFCLLKRDFCDEAALFDRVGILSTEWANDILESLEKFLDVGEYGEQDKDGKPIDWILYPYEKPEGSAGKFGLSKILLMLVVPVCLALW